MKTMFATSARVDSPRHGQYSIARWFEHYYRFLEKWEVTHICVFNNGYENLPKEEIFFHFMDGRPSRPPVGDAINFYGHWPCLPRTEVWNYPGIWRSWFSMIKVAKDHGFERIIYIETDFFLLSKRMASWVCQLRSGLTAPWTQMYGMAEPALTVICEDSFEKFLRCADGVDLNNVTKNEHTAELLLPWTHLEKGMIGDRWGEKGAMKLPDVDYVAQVDLNHRVVKTDMGFEIVKFFNRSAPSLGWPAPKAK